MMVPYWQLWGVQEILCAKISLIDDILRVETGKIGVNDI